MEKNKMDNYSELLHKKYANINGKPVLTKISISSGHPCFKQVKAVIEKYEEESIRVGDICTIIRKDNTKREEYYYVTQIVNSKYAKGFILQGDTKGEAMIFSLEALIKTGKNISFEKILNGLV